MIEYREIEPSLVGRWEEILAMYGIEIPKWRGKNTINGPCVCCGGDDRAHWRDVDGRIALYCRSCANEAMKSPEQVIMELTGISFSELVMNLAEFANYQKPEDVKRAKTKVESKSRLNMPYDHKQDHEKSMSILDKCQYSDIFKVLASRGVQYPYPLPSYNGHPVFPINNENGVTINCATIDGNGIRYLAGGISYGAWHTVKTCEVRAAKGVAWSSSVTSGLHHWWSTGQETRIAFSIYNIIWMLAYGIIKESDEIIASKEEKTLL